MSKSIPYCFYPTTTVIIDDDAPLIKWLGIKLKDLGPVMIFSDSLEALRFLQGHQEKTFVDRLQLPHFKLEHLQKEHKNEAHQEEISCVLIDYAMPSLNGLDLAAAVQDLNFKKLMLTGEADHTIAVSAFNDNVIDRFVLKSTEDLMNVLAEVILDLKRRWFADLSKIITAEGDEIKALHDATFAQHFFKGVDERHITEFYVENGYGDFLFIEDNGESAHYLVRDEATVTELTALAQNLFQQDPDDDVEVLNQLKNRALIPFLPEDFPFENSSLSEWRPYCHPFEAVQGDHGKYYCAFVK